VTVMDSFSEGMYVLREGVLRDQGGCMSFARVFLEIES